MVKYQITGFADEIESDIISEIKLMNNGRKNLSLIKVSLQ